MYDKVVTMWISAVAESEYDVNTWIRRYSLRTELISADTSDIWNMNNSETILMPGEHVTDWRWCNWFTTLFGSTWILIFADIWNFKFAMKRHMNQWLPWTFVVDRPGSFLYFSFSREVLRTLSQKGWVL